MQGFRELIQLHLANEADRKAAKRQEELRAEIAALEDAVARARSRLELAESDVKRIHVDRKTAELDVQKLEDQRSKYRSQLMTAKTNEIYRTLISEIETTARHISEKETIVLQLMESMETASAAVAETKMDVARAENQRGMEQRKLEADVEALEQERVQARARVAELTPQVERSLLATYNRISAGREGRGMALAASRLVVETYDKPGRGRKDEPTISYTCAECHMTVRPQEWVELMNPETLMICQGCKRILYRAEMAAS